MLNAPKGKGEKKYLLVNLPRTVIHKNSYFLSKLYCQLEFD